MHYRNEVIFHNTDAEPQESQEFIRMRSLWRSVITQALMDAASNSKKKHLKKYKQQAIEWLNGDSQDFLEVCLLADMNPGYVKMQAILALKRSCRWRNDYKKMIRPKG